MIYFLLLWSILLSHRGVRQTNNYTIIYNSFSKTYKEQLDGTIELIKRTGRLRMDQGHLPGVCEFELAWVFQALAWVSQAE